MSDSPVRLLRPVDPEPEPKVVELLRGLLDRAERGLVRSIVVATQETGARTGFATVLGDGDVAHLVTAIERAKLRLLSLSEDGT